MPSRARCPTAARSLRKGHGHQSFVVHSAARGDVLLKIALRPEQQELGDVEPDFLAGYGSSPLATPEAAVRYRVALGLELLSGLVYFSTTGQPAMVADYQRRFDEWLAGSTRVE